MPVQSPLSPESARRL